MTTTVRAYLDLHHTITAELDARVNLDVAAVETSVVSSGRADESVKAPALAVRAAIRALETALRNVRIARPERRDHYSAVAASAFDALVMALCAAGVPAK